MSYTLRGRIESRLAALLPVVAATCVLALAEHRWWPIEAVGLMAGIGLALDVQVYHRLLPYQPGWAALPLGLLELGALLGLMRLAGIMAPLGQALALFAAGWVLGQVLGHAGFPLLRLGYAEDGGRLGRLGVVSVLARRHRVRGSGCDRLGGVAAGRAPRGRCAPGAARDHATRGARRLDGSRRARRHRRPRERRDDQERLGRRRRERHHRGRLPQYNPRRCLRVRSAARRHPRPRSRDHDPRLLDRHARQRLRSRHRHFVHDGLRDEHDRRLQRGRRHGGNRHARLDERDCRQRRSAGRRCRESR